jgi:hypothetical protein
MSALRRLEELIERSSLGTPRARTLRARTTDDEVAAINALIPERDGNSGARDSAQKLHIALDNDGDSIPKELA